jgi:hypothetical protein
MQTTGNSVRRPHDRFSRVNACIMLAGATMLGVLSLYGDRKLEVFWAAIIIAYATLLLRYGSRPSGTVATIQLGLGVLSLITAVALVLRFLG